MYKSKVRITQKYLKNFYNANDILSVPYADLQYLLYYRNADFYTCGVYGWNANIYVLDKFVIVTGYHPFGKDVSFELIRKYNEKAKEAMNSNYEDTKAQLDKLIAQFENEVLESVRK